MKRTDKLEKMVSQIEDIDNEMAEKRTLLEQLTEELEVETASVVTQMMTQDVTVEEQTEVQETAKKTSKLTRRIGQGFFNLFKITFTVQFAGVTLIHFTIPKIDSEGNIKSIR